MTIRAGICVSDITPENGATLFGYPGIKRTATSIHDPLEVSVVHIRNGHTGVFLISLDLLCLDRETCKDISNELVSALGISEEHLFIGCSHNHSGPATTRLFSWDGDPAVAEPDDEYMVRVKEATIQATATAAATTAPVGIRSMRVESSLPDGTTDETDVIAVRDMEKGTMRAIVVMSDICPNLLGHLSDEISADFPYYVRKQLREHYGDSLAVIHFTAPCDAWKLDDFEEEDRFGRAEHAGGALANAIAADIDSASAGEFESEITMDCSEADVELPLRAVPKLWDARVKWGSAQAESKRIRDSGGTEQERWLAACEVAAARAMLNHAYSGGNGRLHSALELSLPAAVQLVRIGNIYIAGLPGMLASDYGTTLSEMANRDLYVVSGVGGNLQGYIVTDEEESAGRNSTMVSPLSNEAGMELVYAALSLLDDGDL